MVREIPSSFFQAKPRLGHGRQGVVYDLGDGKCLKVYQPDHASCAELEFHNMEMLLAADIRVPTPYELVTVVRDGPLLVPREQFGGGYVLKDLPEIERVSGLVREHIVGKPYGSFRPTLENFCALLAYVEHAKERGFAFSDGAPANFLLTASSASCIDCAGIVSDKMYQQHSDPSRRFKEAAVVYRNALLNHLRDDLITERICDALDVEDLYSRAGLFLRYS